MAEGPLPEPTALLTVVPGGFKAEAGRSTQAPQLLPQGAPELEALRFKFLRYIEPETGDIDITQEPLLVAVGRGLQNRDDMELVEELAEALGGAVCASRPIVDLGWLPTSRLVGKSGRTVKPKLYLALGISGAPEHVEAITESDLIMAVNTDPAAPIFDLAEYGTEVDMFDLIEAMTEQLQLSPVA
jgi:electron transfer flavoprotein alpha subunit